MDSLRYWITEMRVDGFRFDLASVLGRPRSGPFDPHAPLLTAIAGGLKYSWNHRGFRTMLLYFALANVFLAPALVLVSPLVLSFGTVTDVAQVALAEAVGAVAGGIGGAVIGSKIAGRGNHTVGGLVGAIGGGLLGNAVEKHVRVYTMYDVQVRMDDGSVRTVRQSAAPAVGSRVTVDGKTLHAAPAAPVAPTVAPVAPTAPVGNGGAAS